MNYTQQIPDDYQPIFIGGAGRSGTTLLRVMLNSHPNLCSGPEFKLLPQFMDLYKQVNSSSYQPIAESYLLSSEYIQSIFATFIYNFLEPIRNYSRAQRVVEKSPHNVLVMKELVQVFPNAKFIHVIRDGRDVACSLKRMEWTNFNGEPLWYVENLENATKYWAEIITKGIEDAKSPLLNGKIKFVKYEELVSNPKNIMKKVLNFLEEQWNPSVLDYNKVQRNEEPVESSTKQVSKKLYTQSMNRWQREFTDENKEMFKNIAGSLLIQMGYEDSLNW
ncbi:sulfotransferase family protein [Salinibacillus xinjiangensis]|uniref:sulfotransferase family protein n=1 Tax=Salinibacillus xinjiangensis TaxID=1229268 RepID=UPI001890DAD6|nr:sulfotransferase [Salinibacillus xinjiangensis]